MKIGQNDILTKQQRCLEIKTFKIFTKKNVFNCHI